jgi:hypothetical protein
MKVMFDTSCVYSIFAKDLEPNIYEQLPKPTNECIYTTSSYLRMEFFRRWIITGIELYSYAKIVKDIGRTFDYFSNRFSNRENKIVLKWSAGYINSIEKRRPGDGINDFGWLVYKLSLAYDNIFKKIAQPKVCCKRGEVKMFSEMTTLDKTLQDFYQRFKPSELSVGNKSPCKLEGLLDFKGSCSKVKPIINAELKNYPQDSRRPLKNFQEAIKDFISSDKTPDCEDCYKIGDVLIALDQPPKTTLYHIDHSFSALCPILGHEHKHVQSELKSSPPLEV